MVHNKIFIKFIDEEYVNTFIKDELIHFEPLHTFMDQELSLTNEQIDLHESACIYNDNNPSSIFFIRPLPTTNKEGEKYEFNPTIPDDAEYIIPHKLSEKAVCKTFDNYLVSCFVSLEINDLIIDSENNLFKIKDEVINDLLQLQLNSDEIKRPFVLVQSNDLISLLINRNEQQKENKIELDKITYYNPSDIKSKSLLTEIENNPKKIILYKEDRFSYQREVRLIIQNETETPMLNYKINKLSQFSECFNDLEDVRFEILDS